MEHIANSLREFLGAIRAINEKYKHPRIRMTPMVAFWLLILRLYLIGMLGLLLYKFADTVIR